ncbi:MAG TPA: amino acid permease [Sphingomicrobium sp.]|nr:amino acid permease [Sphingomicrobium sp.]
MQTVNQRPAVNLLRVLGLAFGLAVVVGGVVGQGILRTPGIVAGAVPDPTLILLLWALGGLMITIDACAWAELGSSVPCTGGPYILARRAFGESAGIVVGWGDWISNMLVISFLSVVFGEYCQRLGIGTDWPISALSLGLIAVCWAINWTGTRVSGFSQTLFSAAKGIALIAFVVILFVIPPIAPPSAPAAASGGMMPMLGMAVLVIAVSNIINTYSGWTGSVYFGEEIVDPQRNIARSLFGGILVVILLYLAVNAALLHVLSPEEMGRSILPVGDAMGRVLGPRADTIVNGLALLSVGASANLYLMFNSRVGFAMARDGVVPRYFEKTSTTGTPRRALAASAIVAGVAAASGTYLQLIAVAIPLTAGIVAAIDVAAIVMRRKEPDLPRPFKMPLFPLPALIGLALNLSLLLAMVTSDPWHAAAGLAAALFLGLAYAKIRRG